MQRQFDASNDNQRFQQSFQRFGLIWLIALTIITIVIVSIILSGTPAYLHDWRGAAIIGLSLAVIVIFAFTLRIRHRDWPPPIGYALSIWLSTYIVIALLALIDRSFSWDYFTLIGISFGLFGSRRLILMVSILYVSMLAFQGLFQWPLTGDNIAGAFGLGIFCFSTTAAGVMMQYLIGERFKRNALLQELTHANAELEEAHRQLERSAAQEQELAVLRERTRLAREVHDTLGHALVLISVKLEVAQRLRERDPARFEHELETTKEIVRDTMKELRASIADLRSPALEREPACRAISRYAEEMAQRAGLHVSYDLQPGIEGLPEQIEDTLWKVGQEALANVEKHARASNVVLHISRQHGHILMRIHDDGVGLPLGTIDEGAINRAPTSPEGHYGLSGMFERVESIGGRISLHLSSAGELSSPQQNGTTIEVELPLVELPR
jgi:signal transduction histidine kinase